jgi:hypothetical protein
VPSPTGGRARSASWATEVHELENRTRCSSSHTSGSTKAARGSGTARPNGLSTPSSSPRVIGPCRPYHGGSRRRRARGRLPCGAIPKT